MITIALSDKQRQDARWGEFKDAVIKGTVMVAATDQNLQLHGYALLVAEIRDEEVKQLLADSHNSDANASEKILHHFNSVLSGLKQNNLFPGQSKISTTRTSSQVSEQPPNQPQSLFADLQNKAAILNEWRNLESDILYTAERLWRDEFIGMATQQEAKKYFQGRPFRRRNVELTDGNLLYLETLIRWSRQILLLRIQVSLYRLRASKNFNPFPLRDDRGNRKRDMRQQVRHILDDYKITLKKWDVEIQKLLGKRFFEQDFGDPEQLKALLALFGPEYTEPEEIGWLPFAEGVREVLRFQYYDFRLRQRRLKRQYFKATGYFLLRITTGYGSDPGLFLGVSLFAFGLFAGLYFLNDYYNDGFASATHTCYMNQTHGLTWWQNIIHYVYIAVTNMTSLGSNASQAAYCGGMGTSVLLVLSSLLGYFLLAMLAALLIQKLTESER